MADPLVGVLGATGAVGGVVLEVLVERNFPLRDLIPLASSRSAGTTINFRGQDLTVREATPEAFVGIDVVFSAVDSDISRELAPHAVAAGAVVIDKTSAWRYDDDVPLVIPEVNPGDIEWHNGIISCPNCSTIQMVMALTPVEREFGIQRVIAATYQSVSGAGAAAMQELTHQTAAVAAGSPPAVEILPRQIVQNVVPEVESFRPEDGYTSEEWKMAVETRKIMHLPDLRVSATCVRVPVYRAHSEAITVECTRPVDPDGVRAALDSFPGVRVVDDIAQRSYPTALDASDNDDVWVGRIRRDTSSDNGIVMWVVSDNLRKGAATNSVQIAELLSF
ncbi:MAG: aspartate-semialdehyde dehydrogenase [Chloroflexota bacterium]|jgi:aspartate-semialdehyde dehydrogenase|nr:aspartate-semialdehyde dehydrogenase [Chloroflexota bacterium]